MRQLPKFAAFSAMAVFCGCSPMRYANYTGPTGFWLVGSGTMSETSYSIPVYRGWPERPYRLIGSIRFVDPRKFWDDGVIRMAASTAKHHGGDAIIIRQGAEFGVRKITGVPNPEFTLAVNETTALVVRWLTSQEVDAQREAKEAFLQRVRAAHPDLRSNESVEDIVYQLLLRDSGAGTATDASAKKFADSLYEISKADPNDPSGLWVYKGTLTLSSLTTVGDEEALLGIASVKVDGESVAIVSHTGRTEVNFTGTYVKGRLTGQIGIGGFSTKCDGAAVNSKISLSFQSVTTDGTVRGNVSLQR